MDDGKPDARVKISWRNLKSYMRSGKDAQDLGGPFHPKKTQLSK